MLSIRLICIGKLKEAYLKDAVAEYGKRLSSLCKFEIVELGEEFTPDDPSPAQTAQTVEKESDKILSKIAPSDYVIAMCIEGKDLSSEELSQKLEDIMLSNSTVDFVIGGSWGLSEKLKQRADLRLSMGRMTFPHQLFRVMLCEQIYRAFQISKGTKYHK